MTKVNFYIEVFNAIKNIKEAEEVMHFFDTSDTIKGLTIEEDDAVTRLLEFGRDFRINALMRTVEIYMANKGKED